MISVEELLRILDDKFQNIGEILNELISVRLGNSETITHIIDWIGTLSDLVRSLLIQTHINSLLILSIILYLIIFNRRTK